MKIQERIALAIEAKAAKLPAILEGLEPDDDVGRELVNGVIRGMKKAAAIARETPDEPEEKSK